MKTISKIMVGIFIGMMMSLVISSCAKDDQYQKHIEGVWKIHRIDGTSYENGKEMGTSISENNNTDLTFDFKSDGTLIEYDDATGRPDEPINWKIENGKIIFNTMVSYGEYVTSVCDILELKKSSMILSFSDEYDWDGIHYKTVYKIYFSRK